MVEQDLHGHGHHGTQLLRRRIPEIDNDVIVPDAAVEVIAQTSAMAAMDGNLAPGPVAAREAMDLCVDMARAQGVGLENNPLAYPIPAGPRPPVVLDFGVARSTNRV